MNLLVASAIAAVVWLLTQKFLIPSVKNAHFKGSNFAELSKVGWIAALAYLRKFALVAMITYGSMWLFLKIMNGIAVVFKGADGVATSIFNFLSRANHTLDNIDSGKFLWILVILSIIFILLIVKNAQRHVQFVYADLNGKYGRGNWADLPPSEEMNQLNNNIIQTGHEFSQLSSLPSERLSAEERAKQEFYLDVLGKALPIMQSRYKELDIRRRIIPELEKQSGGSNASRPGWKEKLTSFFTSKGLVQTVYKTSRGLSTAGLVFIFLSFLVSAKTIITTDTNNVVKKIVDLQLQTQQREIDEKLGEELAQNTSNRLDEIKEWTYDDEKVLNGIAYQFEMALANALSNNTQVVSKAEGFRLKANAVKEQVIRTFAVDGNGNVKPQYEVVEQGSRLWDDDAEKKFSKKFSKEYVKNVSKAEPATTAGKQIKEKLKNELRANKSIWEKMKSKYKAYAQSFSKPATAKEVLGMIFSETIDEVGSKASALIETNSIEGGLAKKFFQKTGSNTSKAWMKVKMSQFTDDLIHNTFNEAVSNVKAAKTPAEKFVAYAVNDLEFPNLEKISGTLSEYKPCLDYQPFSQNSLQKSKTALKDLAGANIRKTELFADALSDFKHYFPGQKDMQFETVASDFAGGNGSGGGGGDGSNRRSSGSGVLPSRSYASNVPSVRARSFSRLTGFRRIGGVLIGQDSVTVEKGVDFRDISWQDKGSQMEIFLQRADGKKISTGIYDKDIIQQALSYVADGRLIAATMTQAKPLPFLKILVHPALVNTDLGCKAIGLDRFVDKYALKNHEVESASKSFLYQNILYKYACLRIVANRGKNYESSLKEYLDPMEESVELYWNDIYELLEKGKVFDNPDKSHIASKPKYFNSEIVTAIKKAMAASLGKSNFFFASLKNEREYGDLETYLKVETEQWSGVRELTYTVDKELNFLRSSANHDPNLFPLTFIRQIIFHQNDFSAGYDESVEQDAEKAWEFPELKKKGLIEKLVWTGVSKNISDEYILMRMKSFTLMQRLFRVAFNGDLGLDFPVEKLGELAKETKPYIQNKPTPTWNSGGLKWIEVEEAWKFKYSDEELKQYKLLWESQGIEAENNSKPCN